MASRVLARGVLLSEADSAPLLPPGLLSGAVEWSVRTPAALFADVDAGRRPPDVVLVAAEDAPHLVPRLRRHPGTALLPLLVLPGSSGPPPGSDGRWRGELPALGGGADLPPPSARRDSERAAHLFARFLAARGAARPEDAEAFGVDAPRTLLARWEALGWVSPRADGSWIALPALGEAAAGPQLAEAGGVHSVRSETGGVHSVRIVANLDFRRTRIDIGAPGEVGRRFTPSYRPQRP